MNKFFTSQQIRDVFFAYFVKQQHRLVPSSSLVPHNDSSLLFTNAGMVQFKDVFLGQEDLGFKRAVSVQRCVRSGGKHNDLENVGHTARHHTFFEMLGNFSFGDYFKIQALEYAWEFLTGHLHLPPERLWITVHRDDQETADLWLNKLKIDPARLSFCDADNFWSMGDLGPCGPCTEIFYDHGPHFAGVPPGHVGPDGDRYVEIWNLVFMQYNRAADGGLQALPSPSVDTGMGLERLAAVLQNVHNNYDTDLFQPLIASALELVLALGKEQLAPSQRLIALRIIADHLRSTAFLIMDGVVPSNEGRGYVLRRIMRRALRQGHKLGINEAFFHKLVPAIVQSMGAVYPNLIVEQAKITNTIYREEEQFLATLHYGVKLFEQSVKGLTNNLIPGALLFKLYDTYGFPVDLVADMARELGLELDLANFDAAMIEQRKRSRKSQNFAANYVSATNKASNTEFIGYQKIVAEQREPCVIVELYKNQESVASLQPGDQGAIVLNRTPFYAESGGQVGDQGVFMQHDVAVFKVDDTVTHGKSHLHLGSVAHVPLKIGDAVDAIVDAQTRADIVLHHTATHLLHLVLQDVLGSHATQQGSLVTPHRLRFDFAHPHALTKQQLNLIEHKVNGLIRENHPAKITVTTLQEAKNQGATGLFQDKYGASVRVVNFGPSLELCGGTHAEATGDLGLFKIVAEYGIAAGVRRIEAVTGADALAWLEQQDQDHLVQVQQLQERIAGLEKDYTKLQAKLANAVLVQLTEQVKVVNGINVVATVIHDLSAQVLRQLVDQLKAQLGNAVIVLALIVAEKVFVVAGVTQQHRGKITAAALVKKIVMQLGGKGGGRDDFASGGATVHSEAERHKLCQILADVMVWVQESD